MPDVVVLQHAESEGLGTIEDALLAIGASSRILRADLLEPIPTTLAPARALIVMGGPMGVYDQDRYPFLAHEIRLIRSALDAGLPVLGICLGSQLLAAALGAPVHKGPQKEIGWHHISLAKAAASDPLFTSAPAEFQAFHWHGDVYDTPPGAVNLASSDLTACQAFRHGSAHGILFHMEVTQASIAGMADEFPHEMAEAQVSRATLDRDTSQHLFQLQSIGSRVFTAWAASIGLSARS